MSKFDRILAIDLPAQKSAFLWGPRKVGKSYWLRQHYPNEIFIDIEKIVINGLLPNHFFQAHHCKNYVHTLPIT